MPFDASESGGWPAEEPTEPEGATFVASRPLIRLSEVEDTAAVPAWESQEYEASTRADRAAIQTSSRTVLIESTCADAVYDPSLFDDVTEPSWTVNGSASDVFRDGG